MPIASTSPILPATENKKHMKQQIWLSNIYVQPEVPGILYKVYFTPSASIYDKVKNSCPKSAQQHILARFNPPNKISKFWFTVTL